MTEIKGINIRLLNRAWQISLGIGILIFVIGLFFWKQFSNPKLVTIIILFAVSAIIFSALFFFWCIFFAPELGRFIKSDDTQVNGPTVKMVTTISHSGNANIDGWVERYVFTRNLFGLSVIPLLILGGLFVFG